MKRHETALLVIAVVLLISAWELSSDASSPDGSWTEGEIPWSVLLWQFRHTLAPAFALVGFASAVGILFLRAAHWWKVPVAEGTPPGTQLDQTGIDGLPRG